MCNHYGPASYIKQLGNKGTINIFKKYFLWITVFFSGFAVLEVSAKKYPDSFTLPIGKKQMPVADCYVDDNDKYQEDLSVYQSVVNPSGNLPITCNHPYYPEKHSLAILGLHKYETGYIKSDTKLQGLRVAVVRGDKSGHKQMIYKDIMIDKPPGDIVGYLPRNVSNNVWLREKVKKMYPGVVQSKDEIRVLSHYLDPTIETVKQKVLTDSNFIVTIDRPDSTNSQDMNCSYSKRPLVIRSGALCKRSGNKVQYMCAASVKCLFKYVKHTVDISCPGNNNGECPSATDCALNMTYDMENMILPTVYNKRLNTFKVHDDVVEQYREPSDSETAPPDPVHNDAVQ